MKMHKNGLVWVVLACALLACQESPQYEEVVVGGLYAFPEEAGYSVVKVLAADSDTVHLRVYRNKFEAVPTELDETRLTLGQFGDPEGYGLGHFPLALEGFWEEEPVFIKEVPVEEEELAGYRTYKEAMQR